MNEIYTEKVDFLTGCYMREGLKPFLEKLLAEAKAYSKEFSILLLDVDHFKPFNDKYGHLDGDQVLKYFSSSLRLALADVEATIFRYGGDEFIVVFPDKNPRQAHDIARTIQTTLKERPFLLSGKLFKMSFSGGIVANTDGESPDVLFANADKAMYASKKLGRARATIFKQIWLQYFLKILRVIALFIALAAACAIVLLSMKGYSLRPIKFKLQMPSVISAKGSRAARAGKGAAGLQQKLTTVWLKSGAAIKGTFVKETATDIELKLVLDKGEGFVILKKSIIKKIEREE